MFVRSDLENSANYSSLSELHLSLESGQSASYPLRAHWIIGPPFVDPKSLATMSIAKGVGGWETHQPPTTSLWAKFKNLVCHHADLEKPCGHDTGRIRVIHWCGLDNHCTVRNVCHPGMGAGLLAV